jgi:DNA-binding MarR family transcriptional regulator
VELGRGPQQLAEEGGLDADLGLPADPGELADLSEIAGLGEAAGFGEIEGPGEIASLGETERRRALVAQAARFTAAFARWTDGRSCGGLSYTRLRLLEALHCGGPAIMRELGVRLGVSPRNMTAMVDALEDARLVARRPHPTDRRATLVELSPAGAAEVEQASVPRLDALARLFEVLSPGEQQQFFAALGRLAQEIDTRQDT